MDLFSADLEAVSYSDIEAFLALSAPEDLRSTEGIKIDYKLDPPDDLCDTVAAFANTAGGLIFLGIEEQKKKYNIPVSIKGVMFPGGDIRANLAGKITSQVMPRPEFEIGVAPLPGQSDRAVVVIRIREGLFPPYQFTLGDKTRFPVRKQTTNRMATLREIEQMFSKREAFSEAAEVRVQQLLQPPLFPSYVEPLLASPNTPPVSGSFHLWGLRPRIPIRVRLDRSLENEFQKSVESAFPDSRVLQGTFSQPLRNGRAHVLRWQAQMNCQPNDLLTMVRYFECGSEGTLRFSERIDRYHRASGESVADMFIAGLRFLALARNLYQNLDYFGSLSAIHFVQCQPQVKFNRKFPDGSGGYASTNSIVFPERPPVEMPTNSTMIKEIDDLHACDRIGLVCDFMLAHLRELRFASIEYSSLLAVAAKCKTQVMPFA